MCRDSAATRWRRTLDTALGLGVQHISAYHLTIEPDTAFGRRAARGEFAPVDEAVSEAEYVLVHETLTGAGFDHYEVSNYALPGFRARHNASYWHGVKYLGIGPAAHSFDGRERHWSVDSVEDYLAGTAAEAETLTDRDRFNEYVMTRRARPKASTSRKRSPFSERNARRGCGEMRSLGYGPGHLRPRAAKWPSGGANAGFRRGDRDVLRNVTERNQVKTEMLSYSFKFF